MKAICYNNTLTNLPNFDPIHLRQNLGFAYEDDKHFIHLYGYNNDFKGIAIGLTVIEAKNTENTKGKTLNDWVIEHFGASDIKDSMVEIGHSVRGVWRPGLYYDQDVIQAIGTTKNERYLSEQGIRVLIQKLDEIFLFIEPNEITKKTYSHKIRELLILACTEVEIFLNYYLGLCHIPPPKNGFSTKDYVNLKKKLHLDEFEFNLISYPDLGSLNPFESWDPEKPTQSLFWYNAYNKTKHDRTAHFSEANLWNSINAVVACLVMHCIKFGPYAMFEGNNHFSSVIKQLFSGSLKNDCKESFYIPLIELPENIGTDIFIYNLKRTEWKKDYIIDDL